MKTQLVDMIEQLLADPTNLELVSSLVAPDVTYVSLKFDNPELRRVMPWAGTARGPQAIVYTYGQVGQYWKNKGLTIFDRLESESSAAVFGSFMYESHTWKDDHVSLLHFDPGERGKDCVHAVHGRYVRDCINFSGGMLLAFSE